ncbi:hypothetical protein DVH24_001430 [Malus domestica]|uniref:Uncharacterized protein n=1 Tax=Malus domestica TaxID=3750 RepID=A0A498K173_MALDO|nr:hypothetical protein DVH24_001430 [Malus domestica]
MNWGTPLQWIGGRPTRGRRRRKEPRAREILNCDKNTSGTPRVLIGVVGNFIFYVINFLAHISHYLFSHTWCTILCTRHTKKSLLVINFLTHIPHHLYSDTWCNTLCAGHTEKSLNAKMGND